MALYLYDAIFSHTSTLFIIGCTTDDDYIP